MTLQTTGPISLEDINVEMGLPTGSRISLNDPDVRTLLEKTTGTVSLQDAYGKTFSKEIVFTNSNNITDTNIFNLMGSPTSAADYVFINTATIGGTTTGFALRTGVFPAGSTLKIINEGNIYGIAGSGGSSTIAPLPGGDALLLDMDTVLDNTLGKIYAGGGGGQGARRTNPTAPEYYVEAGGGAGAGFGTPTVYANTSGRTNNKPIDIPATIGSVSVAGEGGHIKVELVLGQGGPNLKGGVGGANGLAGGNYSFVDEVGEEKTAVTTKPAASGGRAIVKSGNTLTYLNNSTNSDIKGAVV